MLIILDKSIKKLNFISFIITRGSKTVVDFLNIAFKNEKYIFINKIISIAVILTLCY